METRKVNLGCGPHAIEGWQNFDMETHPGVIARDLRKGFQNLFVNDSVDFIFSEHFIEHLDYFEGLYLLKECFRVLKPGGVLRISTPDLMTLVNDYKSVRLDRFFGTWEPATKCRMVNEGMRLWGHQFLYDEEEMIISLRCSGFQRNDIYSVLWRKSDYGSLRDLEVRPHRCDLIMEAVKPPLELKGSSQHARVPS